MIEIIKKSQCSGCGACASLCPQKSIAMQMDDEGFLYPLIKKDLCNDCGLCQTICPVLSQKEKNNETIKAYAAWHKNDAVRKASSSGGVFTALAAYVLQENGVVFGAKYNDNWEVEHGFIEQVEQIPLLQGSKYVQSKTGNAYKRAREFLKEGKLVLFSGTPCQIEGLLAFLRKPYDNLITQDIICHGVPSPMAWSKYLQYHQVKNIKSIAFRNKEEGWRKYSMRIEYENGKTYRKNLDDDPMLQVFLKDLCLRPSCYSCSFKGKERISDITLADYWGVEHCESALQGDEGISLLITHTQKGEDLLHKVKDNLQIFVTDFERAIGFNKAMVACPVKPSEREQFLVELKNGGFAKTKRFWKKSPIKRLKKLIKKFLGR